MTRSGSLVFPKVDCPPEAAALFVPNDRDDIIFVDTSAFDRETAKEFWDALIKSPNNVVAINSVRDELAEWLKHNTDQYVVQAINDGKLSLHYIGEFPGNLRLAYRYYVNLLVARKLRLSRWWLSERTRTGGEPSEQRLQVEQAHIQATLGVRALGIAKKGFQKTITPGLLSETFYTDESLVYIATATAIMSGRNVTIFTKDDDIHEQLFKLHHLLHSHYLSMHFARNYMDDPLRHMSKHVHLAKDQWSFVLADPTVTFIERPDDSGDRYYPTRFAPVVVKCINMAKKLFFSAFTFEAGMQEVLKMKERTGGLNVEWVNGKNFHVWPFPIFAESPFRFSSAIVTDRRRETAWRQLRIPELDYLQALVDCERFQLVNYK
jgi:hypothetical protein